MVDFVVIDKNWQQGYITTISRRQALATTDYKLSLVMNNKRKYIYIYVYVHVEIAITLTTY